MSPSGCIGRKASTAVDVDWRNPGCTIPWLLGGRAGVGAGVGGMLRCGCLGCQLKLMWAGDLECAGVVLEGWKECLYHVPVCAIKRWVTKNALWCL